jgi:hypothetical protein
MIIDGNGNVGVGTSALVAGIRLDVTGGAARVNSGATTSTALTTTGRIGINQASPTVPLDVAGAAKITGNLDMNSTGRIVNLVNPSSAQDAATKTYVDNSIPVGGIIMWSGVTLPSNWKLCDGTTYGSVTTPDLREKFVMSSGNSNTIGSEIIYNSLSSSEYTTTTNPTKNFITLNDSNLYLMGSKFGGDEESSPGYNSGFGSKITLTRDGTTAVIASGVRRGQHRVYKFNGYSWSWEGNIYTIEYPDIGIRNLSISDDGTTIAILIANSRVHIYNKNFNASNGSWGDLIQTYTNPYSVSDIFYVDLVKNGATITVAFSCCTNYTSSNTGGGLVIKRYNGSSWSDIGTFNATNEDRFNTYAGALKLSSE